MPVATSRHALRAEEGSLAQNPCEDIMRRAQGLLHAFLPAETTQKGVYVSLLAFR